MKTIPGISAAVLMVTPLTFAWAPFPSAPASGETAFLNLVLTKIDDPAFPDDEYFLSVDLNVPEAVGASAIHVSLGDGSSAAVLEERGDEGWFEELGFGDFSSAVGAAGGNWIIQIDGLSPSTTQFHFDASGLTEDDFFAPPTITNPMHGAVDVPQDTTFTWTDHSGGAAHAVVVSFNGEETDQVLTDDSIAGTLTTSATSWKPPVLLDPGDASFDVFYLTPDRDARIGPLAVTSGTITWSDSPWDPFPDDTANALLTLGSQTIHEFRIASPPQLGVPGDYNDSGLVEQADLDLVLGNWGHAFDMLPPTWTNERPAMSFIDQEELDRVLSNWGRTGPMGQAVVPEPRTMVLLLSAAGLMLAALRRSPHQKRAAQATTRNN